MKNQTIVRLNDLYIEVTASGVEASEFFHAFNFGKTSPDRIPSSVQKELIDLHMELRQRALDTGVNMNDTCYLVSDLIKNPTTAKKYIVRAARAGKIENRPVRFVYLKGDQFNHGYLADQVFVLN